MPTLTPPSRFVGAAIADHAFWGVLTTLLLLHPQLMRSLSQRALKTEIEAAGEAVGMYVSPSALLSPVTIVTEADWPVGGAGVVSANPIRTLWQDLTALADRYRSPLREGKVRLVRVRVCVCVCVCVCAQHTCCLTPPARWLAHFAWCDVPGWQVHGPNTSQHCAATHTSTSTSSGGPCGEAGRVDCDVLDGAAATATTHASATDSPRAACTGWKQELPRATTAARGRHRCRPARVGVQQLLAAPPRQVRSWGTGRRRWAKGEGSEKGERDWRQGGWTSAGQAWLDVLTGPRPYTHPDT